MIVFTQAPFDSSLAEEAQAVALSMSAYFADIKIIFMGDALEQLEWMDKDCFAKTYLAFPLYDLSQCYVLENEPFKSVSLDFIQSLSDSGFSCFLKEHDCVLIY